jgi:hypothetical protein
MRWILCRGLAELARLGLFFWLVMAPLFWIARDGLSDAESAEPSGGWRGLARFLTVWGLPAALLLGARLGLRFATRRAAKAAGDLFDEETYEATDEY